MPQLVPQFQDLTEWTNIGDGYAFDKAETEFSFAVLAPGQSSDSLSKFNFKHISSMNNWWPTHFGQSRELKFLWLKDERKSILPIKPQRKKWGHYVHDALYVALSEQLAAGGCGFKLAVPPISIKKHYRYFTLMRMPVVVDSIRQKLLKKLNYRHIDTGQLASYWINGWEPKTYSHDMEYKFFGITKQIWDRKGAKWFNYNAKQHLVEEEVK